MIRYISCALRCRLPALWLIVTMVFLLAHIVPGDPVQQMLGEGARAEDIQQLRHALGLDLPVPVQYGRYLAGRRARQSGRIVPLPAAGHERRAVALSRDARTWRSWRCWSAPAIAIPAGILAAARRGTRHRPRRRRISRCWASPFPISRSARVLILVFSVILAGCRFRDAADPHTCLARGDARRRAGGDSDAHGAHFGDRRAFERLRAHRARQGPVRTPPCCFATPFATR